MTCAEPRTAPPWLPSALESVIVVTTLLRRVSPAAWHQAGPTDAGDADRMRLVDDEDRVVGRRHTAASSASGAASPSTE